MKRGNGKLLAVIALVMVLGAAVGVWLVVRGDRAVESRPLPIGVEVRVRPAGDLDHELGRVADRVRHLTIRHADGVLVARTAPALVQAPRGRAQTCVLEVDPREGRRFGHDPSATGLLGVDAPSGAEVVLNRALDSRLGSRDDEVTVAIADRRQRFGVVQVVPPAGLARYCGAIVPPGTIASMVAHSADSEAVGLVWVSFAEDATGDDIDAAVVAIRKEVGGANVEVSRFRDS